eukprot:CAMPEP_0198432326 /NCGR_PEP_ID=MMETSP1452-20131203/22455_1 /TAXON_ID=1181717 /ORGANISM="Synchroma pusillum, Strain CCMP3072" /LENGTH=41 /DNA_ID= /DNA_START= /DNA_END= /DNA_ORIENTATION=
MAPRAPGAGVGDLDTLRWRLKSELDGAHVQHIVPSVAGVRR